MSPKIRLSSLLLLQSAHAPLTGTVSAISQFQAGGFPGGPGFAPAMGAAPYGNMGYPPGPGLPFMQPPLMQMDDGGGAGSPGAGKPKKVR